MEETIMFADLVEKETPQYLKSLKTDYKYEWLSYPASLMLIFIIPSFLMWGMGELLPNSESGESLLTIATALASLSALMVTVIIFSITIQRSDIPGSDSLLTLFTQKKGYLPTITFIMGTLVSIIVAERTPLIIYTKTHQSMGVILVVLSVFFLLFLLFNTINSIGREAVFDLLAEDLMNKNRKALVQDLKSRILINLFIREATSMGFNVNIYAGLLSTGETLYKLNQSGYIINVNLSALKDVRELLLDYMQDGPEEESEWIKLMRTPCLTIFPGMEVLKSERPVTVLKTHEKQANPNIERLLEQAFSFALPKADYNPEWEDFSLMVVYLVQECNIGMFKRALKAFLEVSSDYLTIINSKNYNDPDLVNPIYSNYRSPSLESINFQRLINIIVDNGNEEFFKELNILLLKVARIAWTNDNQDEYKQVWYYISILYVKVMKSWTESKVNQFKVSKLCSDILDSTVSRVLDNNDALISDLEKQRPFVMICLRGILLISRRAIEFTDIETIIKLTELELWSQYIFDVTLRQDCHHIKEMLLWSKKNDPVQIDIYIKKMEIIQYYIVLENHRKEMILIIGAWAVLLSEKDVISFEAVRNILEEIIPARSDLLSLIEVGLSLDSSFISSDHHENELGYKNWEYKEIKTGIYDPLIIENWHINFWIAIALREISLHTAIEDIGEIYLNEDIHYSAYSRLIELIQKYLPTTETHQWIVDGLELESSKDQLIELVTGCRTKVFIHEMNVLSEKPVLAEAIEKRKNECLTAYQSTAIFSNLLRKYNIAYTENINELCFKIPPQQFWPSKISVVDWRYKRNWKSEGDWLGKLESNQFSGWLENNITTASKIENYDGIPLIIETAISDLKGMGFAPNLVLMPNQYYIKKALSKHDDFSYKDRTTEKNLPNWLGKLDNLNVYEWTHKANSILIMDLDELIGFCGDKEDEDQLLEFYLRAPNLNEIEEMKATRIPEILVEHELCVDRELLTKIRMCLEINIKKGIFIKNKNACKKIDISQSIG